MKQIRHKLDYILLVNLIALPLGIIVGFFGMNLDALDEFFTDRNSLLYVTSSMIWCTALMVLVAATHTSLP